MDMGYGASRSMSPARIERAEVESVVSETGKDKELLGADMNRRAIMKKMRVQIWSGAILGGSVAIAIGAVFLYVVSFPDLIFLQLCRLSSVLYLHQRPVARCGKPMGRRILFTCGCPNLDNVPGFPSTPSCPDQMATKTIERISIPVQRRRV